MPPEGFAALFNGKDLSGWKLLESGAGPLQALSEADQRHRFVFNGIWEVGMGFQVSGLYFFGSGQRQETVCGGDVIIFRKSNPRDPTPVIHRALFWLEVHGDGTYSVVPRMPGGCHLLYS